MTSLARRVAAWLDDRTGYRRIRHHILDEPLPAGTTWWFTLGSILLFGLGAQVATGLALALYYAPTPDHAWDSVRFITTEVRAGSFLRGAHHWGATVIVVAAVLHLARVVFFGSYKKPRDLNWIVGLILLTVILAFGLTGYLLPWDQRAYWATVVAINVSKLMPGAGAWVASMLRGGPDIGALTLTRWYAIHVLVLPPLLAGLAALHLYLMRRQGISGPTRPSVASPRPFFPDQAARDLAMAFGVGALLVVLAWHGAPALESPADPTSSDYVPRPEWYFLALFQLLKYFPGKLEVIGALVVPGLAFAGLALLPWIDRGRSREWRSRRWTLGTFAAGLAGVATLTILGARDKPPGSGGRWNVQEIAGTVLIAQPRCTRCHAADGVANPIEPGHITRTGEWLVGHVADPDMIAPGLRDAPNLNQRETAAIVSALARLRGGALPKEAEAERPVAVILNRQCLRCHMIDGVGSLKEADLSYIGDDHDLDWFTRWITDPTTIKPETDMPEFGSKLTPDEIAAVAAWLSARK